MTTKKIALAAIALMMMLGSAEKTLAASFVPEQPTMAVNELREGESGYLLTVLQGTKVTKIPVKIVSVVPQNGEVKNLIMVRVIPTKDPRAQELASGMSGSPVFVRGKLVGAIRQGWNFGDHRLGLVTPIDVMCGIFERGEAVRTVDAKAAASNNSGTSDMKNTPSNEKSGFELEPEGFISDDEDIDTIIARLRREVLSDDLAQSSGEDIPVTLMAPLSISGLSQPTALALAQSLGTNLAEGIAGASGLGGELLLEQDPNKIKLKPGDAVSVLLVWGDVDVSSTGTVTATAEDARFLAFGHSFQRRGNVGYPAARAWVHETVYSQSFPFKVASPISLIGTITQDREAGIGGQSGYFAPSISASLVFHDKDRGTRDERRFRVIADQYLSAKLLEGTYTGLLDDAWGRTGQGTMTVTLRIDGKNVPNGWARSNIFYSDTNVSSIALKQSVVIMNAFLTQPFMDNMPLGFHIDVEATQEPLAVLIEDVEAPEKAEAGEKIKVTVTLRPWRSNPVKRDFTLKIPNDASGVCELIVRGGGAHPMSQLAVEGGWLAIDSQARLLEEVKALDSNNELILDLQCDTVASVLTNLKSSGKSDSASRGKSAPKVGSENLLPEEREYLSQTKERRIREGTLKIYRTDRLVDGLLRRVISIEPADAEVHTK